MANDRVTQEPIESVVLPDAAKTRTTQEPVEAIVAVDNAKARASQIPIESIIIPPRNARNSQHVIEVILRNTRESVSVWIVD